MACGKGCGIPYLVISSPKVLLTLELTSPEQTATGKDLSNPLIAGDLLKIIWSSVYHGFRTETFDYSSSIGYW